MSMFHLQKSFEKSLRSSSSTYQVPIVTPLKQEIHKGCTGKAHACGSIKSTNTILVNKAPVTPKAKLKTEVKNLRKNSLSSETVSDSGSEISSLNSNSNGKEPSPLSSTPPVLPKPLKKTKSLNVNSTLAILAARRRTSDSLIAVDTTDNATKVVGSSTLKRGRLLSDGDNKSIGEVSLLRRSSSFRSQGKAPLPSAQIIRSKVSPSPTPPIKRNGSFNNNRLRNSFRVKSTTINWTQMWESSMASKLHGGTLKLLDKRLLESLEKVKKYNLKCLIFISGDLR